MPSPSLRFRLGLLNGNLHKLPYPGCDIRDLRIKFTLLVFAYCGYRVMDGVGDHLRQGLVLADVACEQFVLANDAGDELLVYLVLLFPEADFFADGDRVLMSPG